MEKKVTRPKGETARTKKMRELWLKAAESEVLIPCDSKAAAVLIRFQLYNAVKPVRDNPESAPELAAAVELVQISLQGEEQNVLRIGKSEAAEKLDGVFAALGITGEAGAVKSKLDLEAAASLLRLQERLDTVIPDPMPPISHPYK